MWAGAEEAGAREWEAPMSGSQLGHQPWPHREDTEAVRTNK